MIVLSITMIAIFLLGMLAFGCAKLLCILGVAVSALVLLLKLNILPVGKLSKKILKIISTVGIVAMFTLGALTSMSSADGGINAYEDKLDRAMTLLQEEKLEDAWEEIASIKEMYGPSDNTIMLETLAYIGEGAYDSAESTVIGYSRRTSVDFYTLMEMVYLLEDPVENANNLRGLYIEAATHHPYWTHAQQMAGIALIDRSEFTKAEYHLLRAYEQEPSDYLTAYYLGVSCYEQRRIEDAWTYFQEAKDREADEKTMGYIAWYVQETGK